MPGSECGRVQLRSFRKGTRMLKVQAYLILGAAFTRFSSRSRCGSV